MKRTICMFLFLFMTLFAWQTAASNPVEIESLIKALKSKDPAVRDNASKSLTRIGAPAVPALITGLPEADRRVRLITVRILNQMGAEAEESVPVLIELLRQENFLVHEYTSFTNFRESVSETLANIGSAAVPQLIGVLSDTNKSVHYYAASALGRIGPEARDAVFLLIGMLDDERENIREIAVTALGRIGQPAHKVSNIMNMPLVPE